MDYCDFDSSLQYGKVPSKSEYKLLWVFLGLLFLIPLSSLGVIITILCGAMSWEKNIIITLIIINILFCLFMAIAIYMIYYYKKLYKNILLWLEDAIETTAFVRRMDLVSPNYKLYQVEFSFDIDGQNYRRLSSSGGLIIGFNKRFIKFNNKAVKIFYSPKYDQVLVLKA